MASSVLEAIKNGIWNYEPPATPEKKFDSTDAVPGSAEKLEILAERVRAGLPLWHNSDQIGYDDDIT